MAQGPDAGAGWSAPGGQEPSGPAGPAPGAAPSTPPPPPPPPGWGGAPAGWGGPPRDAPKPGIVPLRPLGLGEVLDGAVSVVRRYPLATLGLSAAVAAVQTVATTAFTLALPDGLTSGSAAAEELEADEVAGVLVGALGTGLVGLVSGIVLAGVITTVLGKAVLGRPASLGEAWRDTRPHLWRLIGVSLLVPLLAVLALAAGVAVLALSSLAGDAGLLLGVPAVLAGVAGAVYVYVRLALASPALVLEKARVVPSLRRSWLLVRGAWWRTFGILLLALVIAGVVVNVLQLPFLAAGYLVDETLVSTGAVLITSVGAGIATALVGPFSAGVPSLLYLDRRMRAEGLDVTLAAAAQSPA